MGWTLLYTFLLHVLFANIVSDLSFFPFKQPLLSVGLAVVVVVGPVGTRMLMTSAKRCSHSATVCLSCWLGSHSACACSCLDRLPPKRLLAGLWCVFAVALRLQRVKQSKTQTTPQLSQRNNVVKSTATFVSLHQRGSLLFCCVVTTVGVPVCDDPDASRRSRHRYVTSPPCQNAQKYMVHACTCGMYHPNTQINGVHAAVVDIHTYIHASIPQVHASM